MSNDDEFYIGYETLTPPRIARRVRRVVTATITLAVALAGLAAAVQRPLARSRFDFGHIGTWQGYLVRTPAPAILVPVAGGFERVWLVGRGKHGAAQALAGLKDGWVVIHGTAVEREPWRMVEIRRAQAATRPRGAPPPPAPSAGGRHVRLRGEIVDSKCFLGVMNPGERIVHRDCAIRCLSGGVTPMVSFVDDRGRQDLAVLVAATGAVPPADLAPFIGRPVELTGLLSSIGDALVLQLESISGGRP